MLFSFSMKEVLKLDSQDKTKATIEVKRIITEDECKCSKKEIFLELNFPLEIKHLSYFISIGYAEKKSYTNSGLFYIEGKDLIVIGPFGNNRFRIKCKNSNCLDSLDRLEAEIKEI